MVADNAAHEKHLGDHTKALLKNTTLGGLFPDGITEDAYKAIKAKLGFAPTCNCPERVEWLNNADKLARIWKKRGIAWLRKKFGGG